MKKVLLLTVVALFVMMPLASFAKTTISDSDLNAITAQEGVVIILDNVVVSNVSLDTQSWGQNASQYFANGGFAGASMTLSGQVVSLNGSLTIDVGTNATAMTAIIAFKNALGNPYGYSLANLTNNTNFSTAMVAAMSGGATSTQVLGWLQNVNAEVGGIHIGLPTIQIGTLYGTTSSVAGVDLDITQVIKVGTEKQLLNGDSLTLGTSYMGNLKATVTGGLYITTH